jgi:hypothetical protein
LLRSASLHYAIFPTHQRRPFLCRTYPQYKRPPQSRDKNARPRLCAKSSATRKHGTHPQGITAFFYKSKKTAAYRRPCFQHFSQTVTPGLLDPQAPACKSLSPQRHKKPRHPTPGSPLHFLVTVRHRGNSSYYARPGPRTLHAQRSKAAPLRVSLTPPPPPSPPPPPIPRHPPIRYLVELGGEGAL